MNLTRIYKAIDEGLKQSLIDFGNNKILKTSLINGRSTIYEQDIEDWYESGEDMPEDMYNELCKDRYIGIYKVKNNDLLNNIFMRMPFKNKIINLNWISLNFKNFKFKNIKIFKNDLELYKYSLDILHWDINKIPADAFWFNELLVSINIPDSVISIEENAFFNCNLLTSINISNNVTSFGKRAFFNCSSLISIDIPNKVTSIGASAFSCCSSLTSILIPNGITSIKLEAFNQCLSLTTIYIPNKVTSIGASAFGCCSSLTSILIPKSVKSIEVIAFARCYLLSSILYYGTKKQWCAIKIKENVFYGVNCIVHCLDGDIEINNKKEED